VALEPVPAAGKLPQGDAVALQQQPGGHPSGAADVQGWLAAAAERHTSGDGLRMATRLLDDFRCSRLGAIALELPPQL
jgi:ribosome biogenesis GTPase A